MFRVTQRKWPCLEIPCMIESQMKRLRRTNKVSWPVQDMCVCTILRVWFAHLVSPSSRPLFMSRHRNRLVSLLTKNAMNSFDFFSPTTRSTSSLFVRRLCSGSTDRRAGSAFGQLVRCIIVALNYVHIAGSSWSLTWN